MIFDDFAKTILNAIGQDANYAVPKFLVDLLSDETLKKPSSEMVYWSAPRDLSFQDAKEKPTELRAVIYLIQGRFNHPYLKRSPAKRKEHQILRELQKIAASNSDINVSEVYDCLHLSAPSIEDWLDYKTSMPSSLFEMVRKIPTELGRVCLARILVGALAEDECIINFLTLHNSAAQMGSNTAKRIATIYRTTIPDFGLIFQLLWEEGIWSILDSPMKPGLPTRPEKIKIFENIDQVWAQTGPCYVQPKHYGWQVQIHKEGEQIWIFGRDLKDLTDQLPGLVDACRQCIMANSVILDGEVLLTDTYATRIPTFSDVFLSTSHQLVIFDMLLLDEKEWRDLPYHKRRSKILEILPDTSATVRPVEEIFIKEEVQLHNAWHQWNHDTNYQGIVVKLPAASYRSAGQSEGKWKVKNYVSLDLVILGYRISQKGYAIFTMGAWDSKEQRFVDVGVLDAVKESKELNQSILFDCNGLETNTAPDNVKFSETPKVLVQPRIVLEVITNGLRLKNNTYKYSAQSCLSSHDQKGYQKRLDKSPDDINTLDDFLTLLKEAPWDLEHHY